MRSPIEPTGAGRAAADGRPSRRATRGSSGLARTTAFVAALAVIASPTGALAYGPGATAGEAVGYAATAVFGQGNAFALLLAGLWIGLLTAWDRPSGRSASRTMMGAALLGIVAGIALGTPSYLSGLIAASGLLVALTIIFGDRLRGLIAALPPAIVAVLFGIGLGATVRIEGAPFEYVAAYFATFIVVAILVTLAGRFLARFLRGGGDRLIRGAGVWSAVIALILVAVAAYPQQDTFATSGADLAVRSATLTDAEIPTLVRGLLEQVYLAFEKEDENETYEALAAVADEEVVADLYIQRRAAMALEDAGGAQARLISLDLDRANGGPLPDNSGYTIRAAWSIFGAIGHWGHTHNRLNRYQATLTIKPIDGFWKLAGFDLTDVVRNDPIATAAP